MRTNPAADGQQSNATHCIQRTIGRLTTTLRCFTNTRHIAYHRVYPRHFDGVNSSLRNPLLRGCRRQTVQNLSRSAILRRVTAVIFSPRPPLPGGSGAGGDGGRSTFKDGCGASLLACRMPHLPTAAPIATATSPSTMRTDVDSQYCSRNLIIIAVSPPAQSSESPSCPESKISSLELICRMATI